MVNGDSMWNTSWKLISNWSLLILRWTWANFWEPSGVIKHGMLENPRTEWRFLARKITDEWSTITGGYIFTYKWGF